MSQRTKSESERSLQVVHERLSKAREDLISHLKKYSKMTGISWTELRIVLADVSKEVDFHVGVIEGRYYFEKEKSQEEFKIKPSYIG